MPNRSHLRLPGRRRSDRLALLATLRLPPPLLPTVTAHRRLRGPYTAAGTILRAIVPVALDRCPDLVTAHDIEILSVAPELRGTVPASRETLTSLAVPEERTRFYSRLRTLRMAHGLAEFLRDHVRTVGGPVSLAVDCADHADPTDQELLAVLLRRLDPDLVTLVVGTDGEPREALAEALARYADTVEPPPGQPDPATWPRPDEASLAAAYVATECTSDDAAQREAYLRLDPAERARLHDRRAAELEARGELSLRLGAIPYHREHGGDPAGAGARALRFALDYCIDMGFYEATVDYGSRGRAIIDWAAQREMWWAYTTKMTTSLAALGRPEEAEELYDEARAFTTDPQVHLQAAYATAMLYTRHHADERKDHRRAKAWINQAIAIAGLLPDRKERVFNSVFHRNGLALVEVHLRNLPEALRLVSAGLDRLDRELGPDEHHLHRSVLRYNRAQVHVGLGNLDDALADYTAVIAEDPNYAEYYFDRANILRRLGRDADALTDYERAMRLSPPYPEVFYNRGDVRADQGDLAGALADFDYVLELDPDYLDARINRAGLLCELGETDAARHDVDTGLAADPDNPHLRCLLGRLEMEAGHAEEARAAFDAALAADPDLATGWANRGVLAFQAGDVAGAVDDLSRALDLSDDPAVRFNRAVAYQALGRWADAVEDLTDVLAHGVEDADVFERRAACLVELGETERAHADLARHAVRDSERSDDTDTRSPQPTQPLGAVAEAPG